MRYAVISFGFLFWLVLSGMGVSSYVGNIFLFVIFSLLALTMFVQHG